MTESRERRLMGAHAVRKLHETEQKRAEEAAHPTVKGIRKPPAHLFGAPGVVVRQCPYCKKGHGHYLLPGTAPEEIILPALCDSSRFYKVRISL